MIKIACKSYSTYYFSEVSHDHSGIHAGAVAGGIVLLILLISLIYVLVRCRRLKRWKQNVRQIYNMRSMYGTDSPMNTSTTDIEERAQETEVVW